MAEPIRARLCDEGGIALVLVLMVLGVLSVSLAATLTFTSSSARTSAGASAKYSATALAEAGINDTMSILAKAFQPATPTVLTSPTTFTYSTGTATVNSTLNGTTWTIVSTGSVRNPTGPNAPNITHTVTRTVNVLALDTGATTSAWSRIYNDDTSTCLTIPAGMIIPANFAARGNLCLTASSITGAATQVTVGGTVTLTPGASQATAATPAGTANGWTNSANVKLNDNVFATNGIAASANGANLVLTGFNFSLPETAAIAGISVVVERKTSASNTMKDLTVQLLKAGTATGSNKATSSWWPTTPANATYGSATDLWGTTWSGSDIDNPSFGVVVAAHNYAGAAATASVDYVTVTVTYAVDASIGTASTPVQKADIGSRCKWSTAPAHTPCSADDHVWAGTTTATATGLSKPTVDFNYWYSHAAPGPLHGCDVKSGTPPQFDNNTTYDNSLGGTGPGSTYQEITPEPGPKDTPPGTAGDTSYTCISKDAQGNVLGRLSWNNQTRVLTVAGTIFFDGNAFNHDHNGYVVHYQGKATIYIAGGWHNDEAICAGGSGLTTCRDPSTISSWDPSQNILVLIIGDKNAAGTNDFDFHTDFGAFQGVIWSKNNCKIHEGVLMSGPVLCNAIELSLGKDGEIPTLASWPPLGSLLPGQLYGTSQNPSGFAIQPGPQTG